MVVVSVTESFLIQSCLLSLGLLIAVYTLVYPKIERMLQTQAENVVRLEQEFEKKKKDYSISEKSRETRNIKFEELQKLKDEINSEYSPPFELHMGLLASMVLFIYPIMVYSFELLGIKLLSGSIPYLLNIFFFGALLFCLLFILIFVRLHSLVTKDFDKMVDKIREATKQSFQQIQHKQDTITSSTYIVKRKRN